MLFTPNEKMKLRLPREDEQQFGGKLKCFNGDLQNYQLSR